MNHNQIEVYRRYVSKEKLEAMGNKFGLSNAEWWELYWFGSKEEMKDWNEAKCKEMLNDWLSQAIDAYAVFDCSTTEMIYYVERK